VPRLPKFQALHDELQLVFYSRSHPFDLSAEKIDIAVHFGGWDWPDAQLTPLCPEPLVAVASPTLLAQHPVSAPRDILILPLLHMSSRPHLWSQLASNNALGVTARRGCTFDQFSLVIEAAVVGMGAAILPTYLIESELSDGQLVQLEAVNSDTAQSYFVATPMGHTSPLAAAFMTWLRKQVIKRV
jgi:LysR family glycine cleavage system transcriptional activator